MVPNPVLDSPQRIYDAAHRPCSEDHRDVAFRCAAVWKGNDCGGIDSYRGAVWDPGGDDESSISVQNLTYDVFCSGTAALFDGRSLIVGGTAVASVYNTQGENRASIFNPATSQYVQCQNMVDGRWYGTSAELADGRIMAMSGKMQSGNTSRTVEIYDLQLAGAGWNPPTS